MDFEREMAIEQSLEAQGNPPRREDRKGRVLCKHCGNRIYFNTDRHFGGWMHSGSNYKACYGGLKTWAEPD